MSIWPFFRKPPADECWRVGDLAECIQSGGWFNSASGMMESAGPEVGDVVAVRSLGSLYAPLIDKSVEVLFLRGFMGGYDASSFRRVPPINAACDPEFAASIKRVTGNPKRVS